MTTAAAPLCSKDEGLPILTGVLSEVTASGLSKVTVTGAGFQLCRSPLAGGGEGHTLHQEGHKGAPRVQGKWGRKHINYTVN